MRSARFLMTCAVAVATAVGIGVVATVVSPRSSMKTAAITRFHWDFGYLEDSELTVYGSPLPSCTHLEDPVALAVVDGGTYSVTLTGTTDATSGCPNPIYSEDGLSISDKSGLPSAKVKLSDELSPSRIKDALSDTIRPVYSRFELPVGFPGGQATLFKRGAKSVNGGPPEFRGEFDWSDWSGGSARHLELQFRGLGLTSTRQATGDPMTIGGRKGWMVPSGDRKPYRFVWFAPRGDSWLGYELYPPDLTTTKAEFISTLEKLSWGTPDGVQPGVPG